MLRPEREKRERERARERERERERAREGEKTGESDTYIERVIVSDRETEHILYRENTFYV